MQVSLHLQLLFIKILQLLDVHDIVCKYMQPISQVSGVLQEGIYMRGMAGAIQESSALHNTTKRSLQASNDVRELRVITIDQLHVVEYIITIFGSGTRQTIQSY